MSASFKGGALKTGLAQRTCRKSRERRQAAGARSRLESGDRGDDDFMVTSVVLSLDLALDPCERLREPGAARQPRPANATEAVGTSLGELAAERLVLPAHDVGAKRSGGADRRPGSRALGGTDQNQRRRQRNRAEGVRREADRPLLSVGGDDCHPSRKMSENVSEPLSGDLRVSTHQLPPARPPNGMSSGRHRSTRFANTSRGVGTSAPCR